MVKFHSATCNVLHSLVPFRIFLVHLSYVHEKMLWPSLNQKDQLSVYTETYTLSTGKLPLVGLPRYSVLRMLHPRQNLSCLTVGMKQLNKQTNHYVSAVTTVSVQSRQCHCCHNEVYFK